MQAIRNLLFLIAASFLLAGLPMASLGAEDAKGPQHWLHRSWGSFPISGLLPYDLEETISLDSLARDSDRFELTFDGFEITLDVRKAEGAKLDLDKIATDRASALKGRTGNRDVKTAREEVKGLSGFTFIRHTYTASNRPKTEYHLIGIRDMRVADFQMIFDSEQPVHIDYSMRIIRALTDERANLTGFKPWKAGSHRLWVDLPNAGAQLKQSKDLTKSAPSDEWQGDLGGNLEFVISVTPTKGQPTFDAATTAAYYMDNFRKGVQKEDNKSEFDKIRHEATFVSGLEASYAKGHLRLKGTERNVWYLVIETTNETWMVFASDPEEGRIRRVMESVEISLDTEKLAEIRFKDSPFSLRAPAPKMDLITKTPSAAYAVQQSAQRNDTGSIQLSVAYEQLNGGKLILPDTVIKEFLDDTEKSVKSRPTITGTGSIAVGSAAGLWVRYTLEIRGIKARCWIYVLAKGGRTLMLNALIAKPTAENFGAMQDLMNSVRVAD